MRRSGELITCCGEMIAPELLRMQGAQLYDRVRTRFDVTFPGITVEYSQGTGRPHQLDRIIKGKFVPYAPDVIFVNGSRLSVEGFALTNGEVHVWIKKFADTTYPGSLGVVMSLRNGPIEGYLNYEGETVNIVGIHPQDPSAEAERSQTVSLFRLVNNILLSGRLRQDNG